MLKLTKWIVLLTVLLSACKKDVQNARAGNEPGTDNIANSSTRLIPLEIVIDGGYDMWIDSTRLTSPVNTDGTGGGYFTPYPTKYFPQTGKFSAPFYIPQEFINSKNEATVWTGAGNAMGNPFVVKNDYYHPNDYYFPSTLHGQSWIAVPRPVLPMTDPTHVRIRLINLGLDNNGMPPVSLAYSNGTRVSPATSGIAANAWSDYIELPYGTYSFRVLTDDQPGHQLHALVPSKQLYTVESPTNYAIGGGQYYAPARSFQPGGIYSVVVSMRSGFQDLITDIKFGLNSFDVITDVAPPPNIQYSRLQVINTTEPNGAKMQIDGGTQATIAWTKASDYSILSAGNHTVTFLDASGNVLVRKSILLKGGDNISLWSYTDASGKYSLIVVSNNMGSLHQVGTYQDGTDAGSIVWDPLKWGMVCSVRFLNLCPDIPFATFTKNNAALYTDGSFSVALAAQNIQTGQTADSAAVYPYVDLGYGTYNNIEVYGSAPNVVPGIRLINTPVLSPASFVSLPSVFYPFENPGREPGVYTVALTGRENNTSHAQMIVIKHNQ